ncbi:MAG: hypothetical protein M1827_000729 [Pycnora praestabilis]|nr:MAG: hypothetical protein M1827_000729 [Pycnora praestabilis]
MAGSFNLLVSCGHSEGRSPAHLAAARSLARTLHAHSIQLVYGGGTTGLMGELAKTRVALGGSHSVHGIVPETSLDLSRSDGDREAVVESNVGISGLVRKGIITQVKNYVTSGMSRRKRKAILGERTYGRTTVVRDLQSRKKLMMKEVSSGGPGSGFIVLSGGYGMMDELMEVTRWRTAGVHNRGICLYNVEDFWNGFLVWIDDAIEAGFVKGSGADILGVGTSAEECVLSLKNYGSTTQA